MGAHTLRPSRVKPVCWSIADAKDQHASSAVSIGLVRFDGKLNGKPGSFVMEDRGVFKSGTANSVLKIISHSGRGELKGISVSGK
jgi:hypothetical protein